MRKILTILIISLGLMSCKTKVYETTHLELVQSYVMQDTTCTARVYTYDDDDYIINENNEVITIYEDIDALTTLLTILLMLFSFAIGITIVN